MVDPSIGRAANPRSIDELYARFSPSLRSFFARRVKDESEIEDLVQQVFERLLRRGNVLELDQLSGYIFQTARSVLTDRARRRQTRHADKHDELTEEGFNACDDADLSPEHVLIQRERLEHATALLLELPELTRVIFVLRRLEEMRYLDIAARLGISVSAVEKHMQRATGHLTLGLRREA